MRKTTGNILYRFSVCIFLLIIASALQADNGDILDRPIALSKDKGTIYELLHQVSHLSGYQFIYDSSIIDNDKKIKIKKGTYSIREAIYTITGDKTLQINVVDSHIILRRKEKEEKRTVANISIGRADTVKNNVLTIYGTLFDRLTNEPIIYGTIGIEQYAIGTVSNLDGEFRLVLPDSLRESVIKFSHVGYQSQEIQASLLAGQDIKLSLEPKIVPLQEIVVRVVNPQDVLDRVLEDRDENYPSYPTSITAFYREGVEHKKNNINITEAVLQFYKTGYEDKIGRDQAKLIKMRRILKRYENDSLLPRMKSGIQSVLQLDIMKNLPDFLDTGRNNEYTFTHTDISVIDNQHVNVISFEQKENIKMPLYKGDLYIGSENNALLEAQFEINPKYVKKATAGFVEKKDSKLNITLTKAQYIVTFRQSATGVYYINHVRGDLQFHVKNKGKLFSSGSTLHLWFEMVNCMTETENVKGFSRKERLIPDKIFSETKYNYDKHFWGDFNVILPEDKLKEVILNNLNEVIEPAASQE